MALIAYSLSLRTQFIGVSDVLFAFVEAKLRASAKQMFSHVDARYVSQTNSEMKRSEIELFGCMALIAYVVIITNPIYWSE